MLQKQGINDLLLAVHSPNNIIWEPESHLNQKALGLSNVTPLFTWRLISHSIWLSWLMINTVNLAASSLANIVRVS